MLVVLPGPLVERQGRLAEEEHVGGDLLENKCSWRREQLLQIPGGKRTQLLNENCLFFFFRLGHDCGYNKGVWRVKWEPDSFVNYIRVFRFCPRSAGYHGKVLRREVSLFQNLTLEAGIPVWSLVQVIVMGMMMK